MTLPPRRPGLPRHTCGTLCLLIAALLLVGCTSKGGSRRKIKKPPTYVVDATRVADPKLPGGGVDLTLRMTPSDAVADAVVEIVKGPDVVAEVWTGTLQGNALPVSVSWDGRDTGGEYVGTGDYEIRIREPTGSPDAPDPVVSPLSVVRLGIGGIDAQSLPGRTDDWQMVYFLKGAQYAFYATPAIHEYIRARPTGEISDMDLDSGDPRPIVPVHTATDSPALEGVNYDVDSYNYPLCYRMGAQVQFEVILGDKGTSAAGQLMSAGYPIPWIQIRLQAWSGGTLLSSSGPVQPGGKAVLVGPILPAEVTRVDIPIRWTWQSQPVGDATWTDIPGSLEIPLRFYTVLDDPKFKAGATGTQYAGPWVEVAEYWYQWKLKIGAPTDAAGGCVETHVKGFFGQNSGIPTAIEGMMYDTVTLGGGSGDTHYFTLGGNMNLSALLNNHARGLYFNCTDNMGATTTMVAMMGVADVQPVRLGLMNLNCIWGIGAPDYTTNLWGGGGHGFAYHHIVTRDGGTTVIDTCMQLDEDGNPSSTPGTPGWNDDRPWAGPSGYDQLSSTNTVSTRLETLPGLQ